MSSETSQPHKLIHTGDVQAGSTEAERRESVRQLSRSRCLLSIPMTQAQSLGHTQSKKRTDALVMFSDLHNSVLSRLRTHTDVKIFF